MHACDVSFLALPGSANIGENGEAGKYTVFQQVAPDYFQKIWYLKIFRKSVEKFQAFIKTWHE